MTVIDEVGKRCFPGEHPEIQAELSRSVGRLDAYVAANDSRATPGMIAEFKRTQGHVGGPQEFLCKDDGDPAQMYRAFRAQGSQKLRETVDKVVARAGPPTWGDCL